MMTMTMTMAIIIIIIIISNNQRLRSAGDKNGRSKRCALRKLQLSVLIVTASC